MIISMTGFVVNSPPVFDIPNVEPDGKFEARLEHVMLEGHLLEVTVSEMCTLWEFKQTLREYKITKLQPVEPKVSFAFCKFLYTYSAFTLICVREVPFLYNPLNMVIGSQSIDNPKTGKI